MLMVDGLDKYQNLRSTVTEVANSRFENNKTCHEYCLGHNPVGDSTIYRWLGMIKRNSDHLIFVDVTNRCDPLLFKQIGDECAKNKKDWLKAQKKKGGKKGKGGKKKK